VEVQNFGQVPSSATELQLRHHADGDVHEIATGTVPPLKPFETTTLELSCGPLFRAGDAYEVEVLLHPDAPRPESLKRNIVVLPVPTLTPAARLRAASGQTPNRNQGFDKLLDGRIDSKCCLNLQGKALVLDLTLPEARVARGYSFVAGNDVPARDPKAWTVQGSPDGVAWTALARVENQAGFKKRLERRRFPLDNDTAYRFYRFTFSANHGDPHFQLSELELDDGRS